MKIKTCYFCNSALNGYWHCQACEATYDLEYVYNNYVDDSRLCYSSIFKVNYKLLLVIGVNINEIHYRVILRFLDWDTYAPVNETEIYDKTIIYVDNNPILTLQGYPLTPANIKDKLKTYLLFS
jgi:hypothetical protein